MSIDGVLIVKNQCNTVGMAIESVAHVVDKFYIVDNNSSDRTRDVIEETVDRLGFPSRVETRPGDHGKLLVEVMNQWVESDFALRVEGDQVHFPDRLERMIEQREKGKTVKYSSRCIQNRLDLQNKHHPTNAPHPMIYDADIPLERRALLFWPRQDTPNKHFSEPINVNVAIHRPIYRLMRWHRTGGYGGGGKWWNRPIDDPPSIPDRFEVSEVDPPYKNHFSMREYMRLLRERGKGSIQWDGDTLAEVAEKFVEWDTQNHTEPYEGEYPPLLQDFIEKHGYDGLEDYCPI